MIIKREVAKSLYKTMKPFYDHRFNQWCILFTPKNGGYGGVWANSKEACIRKYKEVIADDN